MYISETNEEGIEMTDIEYELINSSINQELFIKDMLDDLEKVDFYTAEHCRRVGKMTDILCEYLGEGYFVKIKAHIASYVHDIGKIAVPKKLLIKIGEVTDDEWTVIRSHPLVGDSMLKDKQYHELAKIVLYHHERWDGKGYYELDNIDIPTESRIIAVCDSIDAMITRRAYRDPLSLEMCKKEISVNSGKMYEPRVAEAALQIFDELTSIHSNMILSVVNE